MSLRSKSCSMLTLALLGLLTPARGDDLLEYLDARGLDSLAALRVEELAARATAEERAQLLDQLADLFSRMLDGANDPATHARLLERADALADDLLTAKGDRLRVASARARYRDAARLAEGIRAGIAGDAAPAIVLLATQADVLQKVSERAGKRADDFDKRAERAQGLSRDVLIEQMQGERSLVGQSRYLAAWSLLYRGFLVNDSASTKAALAIFIELLGGRDGKLTPKEVSEDLRGDEAFASAILGLALAKSRVEGYGEGARWIELLDDKDTFAGTREALPGWTMVAALEGRAFKAAREQLKDLALRDDAGNWARVAVSRAIEDGSNDEDAQLLLSEGIAMLAAKRDLNAIRDLVARYGEGILGSDSTRFVPRYVRAVKLYDASQTAMLLAGEDRIKLKSPQVRDPSIAAAEALGLALEAEDAKTYADAAVSCTLMRAWSLRGAGRFDDAAKLFDSVSENALGERAEDAARFAITCFDDAHRATTDQTSRDAAEIVLVARIDAYLSRFPGSDHVPELLIRKVAATAEPTNTDVDQLMRVSSDSKDWLTSRRQALAGLYRTFRGGKTDRVETGRRYLAVLAELPVDPKTKLPASSAAIARQALEVVLSNEMRDTQTAISLIAALEIAGAEGQFDLRSAEEEIAYRRLQIAILSDRWADAEAALAPFEKVEATPLWADAALRLAMRGAEAKRRAIAADAPERGGYVATIVRAGDAIFVRAGGPAAALAASNENAAVHAQLGRLALDARIEMIERAADAKQAAAGLILAEALLVKAPLDATLLRGAALCAEATGDYALASDRLRSLVGGLPSQTTPWFRAKADQIRVLSKLDPSRARIVMDQFRAMNPQLGPEPFRAQFAALDSAIPREIKPSAPATTAPVEVKP